MHLGRRIRQVFQGRQRQAQEDVSPVIAPDRPFCAVGDVHGADRLLAGLLDRLEANHADKALVFLGDYVDRGTDSAAVLHRLARLSQSHADRAVFLKGNHEQMMLDFLAAPTQACAHLWLRNGGLHTLASFGVSGSEALSNPDMLEKTRDALEAAVSTEILDWMKALPLSWQSGNVFVSHAGPDPRSPLAKQEPESLLWGSIHHYKSPPPDAAWAVHGHVVVDAPQAAAGWIATDTGAYATGVLSAAVIEPGRVVFEQVGR